MFNSTKEFDEAIYKILMALRNGAQSVEELQKDSVQDDDDFEDALQRAIDLRLVKGMSYTPTQGGGYVNWFHSRVTYEGLAFIENWDMSS